MRTTCRVLLVLGVAALLAGPAWAQGRRGGGGFGGPAMLLRNKSVQQEIKLTDEQVKKVNDLIKGIEEKHKDDMEAARGLEGQERFQKMGEINRAIGEELMKSAPDVLQPEQIKRFKQISLQTQGARAFNNEEVQKDLKLTDDQKDKIKTINEDAMQEMRSLFQPGGDREEMQKKMQTLQKETMEKISAVLTDDQKKSWKEMTGEPFQVKFEGGKGRGKKGKG